MLNKTLFFFLILPTLILNFFTLTLIDTDNNLSVFSTISITLFNIVNLILAYILAQKKLKKFVIFFSTFLFFFILIDFSFSFFYKNQKIQINNKKFGWVLNKNIEFEKKNFTKKKKEYFINFKTSNVEGFREFPIKKYAQNILILGDSFTAGPFASNTEMYYSYLKKKFDDEEIYFNWFVGGGGGYSTLQQFLLLEKYVKQIQPDIFIHQFCENDFENNSKIIEKNSILRNQYFFRPYYENGKIVYDTSFQGKIYKYIYKNSFFFRKIDRILMLHNYKKKQNYYNKQILDKELSNAKDITQKIFNLIRETLGDEVLYISFNCSSKNKMKKKFWQEIVKKINGHAISKPSDKLIEHEGTGKDIYYMDGVHLNKLGNELIANELYNEINQLIKDKIID